MIIEHLTLVIDEKEVGREESVERYRSGIENRIALSFLLRFALFYFEMLLD
jgi:hypothetical protein